HAGRPVARLPRLPTGRPPGPRRLASRPPRGRELAGCWPGGDEEGLGADAHWAVEVGKHGGGQPGAAGGDVRLRVQADPFARGLPVQVDGELWVDEVPAGDVQFPGGAVAAVGDGQYSLQRAGLLVRHERVAHPRPEGGRTWRAEASPHPAPFNG